MIVYIIIAVVLIINIINPRILWYIDSWKYKDAKKEEPSSLYVTLCRALSALGVLILVLVFYFRPIYLTDLVNANSEMQIVKQHIYVENGEPVIDSETYDDLSEDQIKNICESLGQYPYHMTFGTLFSDGSLSDLGEWIFCFYIYEDQELFRTVIVSDAGKISVNNKSYVMQNASTLIQEISDII